MFLQTWDRTRKAFRTMARVRAATPREIQIEITNRCNMACEMCPHTYGQIPPNEFPLELLSLLLESTPPVKQVVLTGWGEPTLHPQFSEFFDRIGAKWPMCNVRFTTNGMLLDERLRDVLLKPNCRGVSVSIDLLPEKDAPPQAFRDLLHPPFKRVVKYIREWPKLTGVRFQPQLRLQSVVLPEIESHTCGIIELARESGADEVNLVRLQIEPGKPDYRPPWDVEQQLIGRLIEYGAGMGVRVNSINRQSWLLRTLRRGERFCLKTDDSLYITTEGGITPCCNLRECVVGNLDDCGGNLIKVWCSPEWNRFFVEQRPVCGGCDALAYPYLA